MPQTLNALIRYKTINSCLYGGKRKWSIGELIDACSASLADARGRYNKISERTIRDDIRVLRSDILGFNAPIEQEKGLYFYSDPQYSIFTLVITDPDLAARILAFLKKLRDQVQHPELESILELLGKLAVKPGVSKGIQKIQFCIEEDMMMDDFMQSDKTMEIYQPAPVNESWDRKPDMEPIVQIRKSVFTWGDIFEKIIFLTS